jgi:hypothetical protein
MTCAIFHDGGAKTLVRPIACCFVRLYAYSSILGTKLLVGAVLRDAHRGDRDHYDDGIITITVFSWIHHVYVDKRFVAAFPRAT